jgi:hypothetical protein
VFDRAKELLGARECWAAVIDRIRGGHIRALARSSSSAKGSATAQVNPDPLLISHDFWRDWIEDTPRLYAGDARFLISPSHYGGRFRTDPALEVLCFGVRLDPEQVKIHFPEPEAAPPAAPVPVHDLAEGKGPAVSQPDLNEWAKLFRAVYPHGSEGLAAKSAVGMFQGKSVPRSRLRIALDSVGKLGRGRPANKPPKSAN